MPGAREASKSPSLSSASTSSERKRDEADAGKRGVVELIEPDGQKPHIGKRGIVGPGYSWPQLPSASDRRPVLSSAQQTADFALPSGRWSCSLQD